MKLFHSFRLLSSSYAGIQQYPNTTPTGCDMTRLPTRRLLALALAAGLSLPAVALAAEPFVASDIRVDGLQRIASGTVFTYLPVNRGDTVDDAKVADAIRALYRTGFFEDVQLDRQGNILVITVKERPAINKLTVTGNKDIKSEELLKGLGDIGLTEGGTFDRLSLDRVTQELTRQYNNRGKYNVEITPTVSPLDRNRVDVAIAIKEGKAAKIRHVNLIGTEKVRQRGHPGQLGIQGTQLGLVVPPRRPVLQGKRCPATWRSSTPGTWTAAMWTSASTPPRCRSAPTSATCSSAPGLPRASNTRFPRSRSPATPCCRRPTSSVW